MLIWIHDTCIKYLELQALKKIIRETDKKLVKDIILKLSKGEKLEERYKDHNLIGNYLGCRECHIKPDLLLIYRVDNDVLELALVRVGSHAKLF